MNSSGTPNCTSDYMQFTNQTMELFTNPIDLMLFTTAVTLKSYVNTTELHVTVDGARDQEWPGDNIEDQELLSLLCTTLLRDDCSNHLLPQ